MLAFVTAQGDPHVRVVAVGNRPGGYFMRYVMVLGITTLSKFLAVRRVQKYASRADVGGNARSQDALPIAAADSDPAQAGCQGEEVFVKATG